METKLKMKNGSHRYDINRTRPRHGQKYIKHKMCLSKMMVMCNKHHLSNIWNWIYGKVKQHWGWVEKKRCLKKKRLVMLHNIQRENTVNCVLKRSL